MARARFSRMSILIVFLVLMISGIYLAYGPITGAAASCGEGQCAFADKCFDDGACMGIQYCRAGLWYQCKLCCIEP
jgi:hypothetical protein